MADSNTQPTGKTPVPPLDTDNSKLKPGTPGGSPPPTSPASLAPPESSAGSVLSRPVSPIEKETREFIPIPSTLAQPETPSPKSYYHSECPRAGLPVSSAQERIAEGIPIGSRLYVHDDPERLNNYQKPRRGLGRILGSSQSTQVHFSEPTTTTAGSQDPKSLPPITAAVTAGPILLVEKKPCLVIPSPMPEDRWRATASAIVERFDRQSNGDKMVEKTGKYLSPLRNPATKPRKNSIADGVRSAVNVSLVATRGTMRPSTKVGRVWICSMGCETLSCRKRDWALVELDPNVVGGPRERRNEAVIGGRMVQLRPPKKEKSLSPGTRVVLATVDSRTVPVAGVVGERQPLVFGYQMVQKITLDRGSSVTDGDAGACVVDEENGQLYGILVMMGMLSKDVESGKKAGGNKEGASGESVAWFVPYQTIAKDIGESFPIEVIEFPEKVMMGGE